MIDPALTKTHRISAEYTPGKGAIGCSLSHIKALRVFEAHPEWNTCLIVEDDFTWDTSLSIPDTLSYLMTTLRSFDIILLAYGVTNYACIPTSYHSITRILSSQTASGYIVHRRYLSTLLANFVESNQLLQEKGIVHEYCLDQWWKRLMPTGKWFSFHKRFGYQYESFSDIEQRVTNYQC
jgi:GR25 family glycosyltransferase involved in LPS biosynthesis